MTQDKRIELLKAALRSIRDDRKSDTKARKIAGRALIKNAIEAFNEPTIVDAPRPNPQLLEAHDEKGGSD